MDLLAGSGSGCVTGSAIVAEPMARSEAVIAHGRNIRTPSGAGTVRWLDGDLLAAEGKGAIREASAGGPGGVIATHSISGSPRRPFPPCDTAVAGSSGVASQAGSVGEPDNAAYSASKFPAVGWIRHLAGQASEQDGTYHVLCAGCTEPAADHRARSVRQSPRHRDRRRIRCAATAQQPGRSLRHPA
ncbi:hypothetical protein AB0F91_37215 [Amycolatopsis sp. NPDC023774]|uniref:hypothetical protein n=1 Tax=Amycolatopsis sp. NPDC023774 TaxID=3155015 RepID=UPI003401F6E4